MSVLDKARAALAGTIAEIEQARRALTAELIGYRAGEKLAAARAEELGIEAERWRERAESAVLAGDDTSAREALGRRGEILAELDRLRADREEQSRLAAEMLRGRRELDAKLEKLKLREGTVAIGLAQARSGGGGAEDKAFERFAEAERRIEDEAAVGELGAEEIDATEMAQQKVNDAGKAQRADELLEELKRKMKEPG